MPKPFVHPIKTIAISSLILLIAPFIINCFFAYPQTDDFSYSVASRDLGLMKAQYDCYINWSGRFTSTALLSINPLVYGSITGYRLLFVFLIIAQFASLYLLVEVLTKKALSCQDKLIFSMTFLFAFLDQMDDVRSGLYWMAGVITYQVAGTLMILFFTLFHLINQDQKHNNAQTKAAVILLSVLMGGTNEISLVLTFLITALLIYRHYALKKLVSRFQVITFLAVATGSCFGLFAPGNFARMKDYEAHRDIFIIAASAFSSSLAYIGKWITSPLVLILMTMVFFTVISRPQLKSTFGNIKMAYSTSILLFLTFTSFFIPYWSTGMLPQNRVLNMIYFFFLIGWMINLAVIFANLGEHVLALGRIMDIRLCGCVVATYIILLFGLQTSNFVLVTRDLLSGTSFRYSKEMQQIQSQITDCADDICTVEDVTNRPYSLYFYFIGFDAQDWANGGYAAYFRKKRIFLIKEKKET